MYGAAARGDGAVVLGGRTFGKFGDALINDSSDSDFAVVAIDANGTELWRWQVFTAPFGRYAYSYRRNQMTFQPAGVVHQRGRGTARLSCLGHPHVEFDARRFFLVK